MGSGYGSCSTRATDFNFAQHAPASAGRRERDQAAAPRSSITPTILFKGRRRPASGSPAARHIKLVYNVLINLVDHGMTIQQAVDAPRSGLAAIECAVARDARRVDRCWIVMP